MVDELLGKAAGNRIAPSGWTDASKGNMAGDFENWLDTCLWPSFAPEIEASTSLATQFEISTNSRASSLRYDVSMATIKENRVLTSKGEPLECHMDIELPPESSYQCGDYLAVLPLNSEKSVKLIMNHFSLPGDAVITIKATGPSVIPTNTPLSVFDVLRSYVELSQPATKKNVKTMAAHTEHASDKAYLQELTDSDAMFDNEIVQKRASCFGLLAKYSSIKLSFGDFMTLLPPLQIRQYSISSSPLAQPLICSITYGVIDSKALSDHDQRFEGVTGAYLRGLQPGDSVQVSIRPTAKKTFRLPVDSENTPLLMFAAGTGLTPFRGFLQERALQRESNPGKSLAPALLFLGCWSATKDRLYAEQVDDWIKKGVVDVRYSYSQERERSQGCAFVQDRMLRDEEDVIALWRNGARVYVCGSRKLLVGVREAAGTIAMRARGREPFRTAAEQAELESRFRAAMEARVATDVFS